MDDTCIMSAIPPALADRPQWILWRDEAGRKMPYSVAGTPASSTDPLTWSDYDTAAERLAISDRYSGLGFVFAADDPFCGIDLDGCRQPATGFIEPWAQYWIDRLASYTEVSPSGTGIKIFSCGRNSRGTGGNKKIDVPAIGSKKPGVEIYDQGRYFAVTGRHVDGTPATIEPAQDAIDEFVLRYWPAPKVNGSEYRPATPDRWRIVDRAGKYVAKMPPAISGQRGHDTALHTACEIFRFGLTDVEARSVFDTFNQTCIPPWNEREIEHKLVSARDMVTSAGEFGQRLRDDYRPVVQREQSAPDTDSSGIRPMTVRHLLSTYPRLREPVIHGLLREGETMNIIAPPKVGKSWFVTDLALCVATGRPWLDTYEVVRGNVLIVDNELHGETSANRIPKVADARGIPLADYGDSVQIASLRGRLTDLIRLHGLFSQFSPGVLRLVIIDAFYRTLPAGIDENDNGAVANLYNHIDRYALQLGCSFVLIHHASKGNQSGKAVTDVGSGAGSQSRATDTHLILRPHEQESVYVLDAAVRSWAPVEPRCLRWEFPVWQPADDLDPADLRPDRPRRQRKAFTEVDTTPPAPKWTAEQFAAEFVADEPMLMTAIVASATGSGLSERRAIALLRLAEADGSVHRWSTPSSRAIRYATKKQTENKP